MANELRAISQPGEYVYGLLWGPTSLIWNGTTFEAYSAANYSAYIRTVTEQGGSGVYVGSFPVAITTAGRYELTYYLRTGATPAEGDVFVSAQSLNWDGTAIEVEESVSSGYMTGADWLSYVLRAFKRTDKNTEVYDATKDTIDDMRIRMDLPEDEVQADFTDQIGTLGEYSMDLESDFGRMAGPVVVQEDEDGWDLVLISKASWDRLYLANVTDESARGRPRHYAVYGNKIYVGPVPDKTSYVYKKSYTQDTRAAITSATGAVPFTHKYRETMRWGVLQRLYSDIVKNDDQAAKCGLQYENGLRKIEKRIDRNRGTTMAVHYRGV